MKTTILSVLLILSAFSGAAFAQSTEFQPYNGPQLFSQIRIATPVERRFAVPVYFGWPDRPYHVFGHVTVWNDGYTGAAGTKPERSAAVKSAASAAKLRGADAIMLVPLPINCTSCNAMFEGPHPAFMVALAIKWQ